MTSTIPGPVPAGAVFLRAVLAIAGAAALGLAVLFIDGPPDLAWNPAILPLAALGISLLIAAAAWASPWRESALLAGLLLTAQACSLQLIEAERYANYAHYRPLGSLLTGQGLWLVPVALQWGSGASRLWRHRERARIHGGSGVRAALVLAFLAFGAAVPTASVARYAGETAIAMAVTLGAILNLAAAAAAMPEAALRSTVSSLGRRITLTATASAPGTWDARLPWLAAGFATLAAALFARFVFEGVPHIDDSVSNLFQARTFAAGKLSFPAPPDSAAFQVDEVLIANGRWFGYGFPGWPAALAAGVVAGVPWLVNPLLAGLAILLNHRLLLRLHDRATANQGTLLLAASPWLLFMSSEMMGHPLALVLALAALLGLSCGKELRVGTAALAGLALGALALTRPLDAAVIGAAGPVWAWLRGARLPALVPLAAFGSAAVSVASLGFAYNHALTGDWLYTPQMMWTDRAWGVGVERYGFGADIGVRAWPGIDPLPGHGLADVALNLNKNLFAAGTDLFGLAGGSLTLLAAALVLPGRRTGRAELALVLITVLAYSGYWFAGGPDLGPRYWYVALPALVLLSVLGARKLSRFTAGSRVGAALVLAMATSLLTFIPWRAATKYYRYRDIGGELRAVLQNDLAGSSAVVFVRGGDRESWQAAFNFLEPSLEDTTPVFARDTGPASRKAVLDGFPGRTVWILGPGSGPDRRLRILAGPLPPDSLR